MQKMPKVIYVLEKKDGHNSYLIATENPDGDNGETVFIYRLVSAKTLKIKMELV